MPELEREGPNLLLPPAPVDSPPYELPRGTWQRCSVDGRVNARIGCPGCGQHPTLGDHLISSDGTVTPGVVCPLEPCNFHDWVKLDGWCR